MINELEVLEEWLGTDMAEDATVAGLVGANVFSDHVRQSGSFPAITWRIADAEDINVQANVRTGTRFLVQVMAINRGDSRAGLYQAFTAAEAFVMTPKVGGGFEIDTARLNVKGDSMEDGGVKWTFVLGDFEVWVRPNNP